MLMYPAVPVTPGTVAVPGFLAGATYCGLRKSVKPDLALILAPAGAAVAGVFTQSRVVAAPVTVARERVAPGFTHALIINAGNANACTGQAGMAAVQATVAHYEDALGLPEGAVVPASTGVIGVPLNHRTLTDASVALTSALTADATGLSAVADAIMTTDLVQKACHATFQIDGQSYTVCGVGKGSGMIKPNMATVIGVLLTDAPLTPAAADALLRSVADQTFNCVTVDGDTSTNDTLILMASGAYLESDSSTAGDASTIDADHPELPAAEAAIGAVAEYLARAIARDGEGATKLIEVWVSGAPSFLEARTVAHTIAESPLVKTAIYGNDANWGRVAAAAGRAGVAFDQADLAITFAGIPVCHSGTAVPFDEDEALAALSQPEVTVEVSLGAGPGTARVLTCDLTHEYIRINGEYRT